jgi:hypothetical protein
MARVLVEQVRLDAPLRVLPESAPAPYISKPVPHRLSYFII